MAEWDSACCCRRPRMCCRDAAASGADRHSHPSAVSTYAPVQGATLKLRRWRAVFQVSTHAPVQGATGIRGGGRVFLVFQPTPLCKGRRKMPVSQVKILGVSTHAPVQGATSRRPVGGPARVFQPTPLCKGRQYRYVSIDTNYWFQPTPLCKGRLRSKSEFDMTHGFNPRPCARGDQSWIRHASEGYVSTHAPVQGATSRDPLRDKVHDVSTHAPVQGATSWALAVACSVGGFNPRPCARGDRLRPVRR